MQKNPPKLADRFLSLFCKGDILEEVQGDLYEYYQRHAYSKSKIASGMLYWYHVINFIRPFAIKKSQNSNYNTMFKYNLILAYRNMLKHKFYSTINISGLAIAITCCIFITIYVLDEISYDKHFSNFQNIYRIHANIKFEDNEFDLATAPAPLAAAFQSEFPEVIKAGRIRPIGSMLFKKGDYFVKQDKIAYADQNILEIFDFDFIYGSRSKALIEPNSVVLSRKASEKFFGYEDPVGKLVTSASGGTLKVLGVYEDIPQNTHFHFEMLIPSENDPSSKSPIWLSNNHYTYIQLQDNFSAVEFQSKIPDITSKYVGPQVEQFAGVKLEDMFNAGGRLEYTPFAISDIHLKSAKEMEIEQNGNIQYIYIFMAVGVFILVLACINFMNLSTAKSANRAKEVGMRKILGTGKMNLILQFVIESIMYSFLAFIAAVVLTYLLLPLFNLFVEKNISDPFLGRLFLAPYLLVATIVVGILAGIYPAIFMTGIKPLRVLKGELTGRFKTRTLRNILVTFQFIISLILIIGTSVVYKQFNYSQTKSLGYDKDKVILVKNARYLGENTDAFKNDLLANTQISNVTTSSYTPSGFSRNDMPISPEEKMGMESAVSTQIWRIDHEYLKTMGMKILQGRDFDANLTLDTARVIINQTLAGRLGFDEPIGRYIKPSGNFDSSIPTRYEIIGVVEDFHFDSFKEDIYPLLFILEEGGSQTAIRYTGNDPRDVVNEIMLIWEKHAGGHPFEYAFLDQEFNAKFRNEKKLGTIFATFAFLAVFIACLGLFGLSAFTAEQRRKEIGIRKVLGASIYSIVSLLFTNFTKLLVISFIISVPCAYILMSKWLEGFIYRTSFTFDLIGISCVLVFILAWVTVSFQSFKAAKLDPAKNLKYE